MKIYAHTPLITLAVTIITTAMIAAPAPAQTDGGQIDDIQTAPEQVQPAAPAAAVIPGATATEGLEEAAPVAAADPEFATTNVKLSTARGDIVIALETERAPVTAKNFLRYVREGRFNGMTFYRASNIAEGYGLVQGGTQGNPKMVLPAIRHEPTTQTGLTHTDGTISMAMGAPGPADGDFFIIVGDLISLDAKDGQPGFAAFGRVTQGMDIVRTILAAPTDPNKGEGVMRGQFLADPVKITSATRID